jgi:hypothetical protein
MKHPQIRIRLISDFEPQIVNAFEYFGDHPVTSRFFKTEQLVLRHSCPLIELLSHQRPSSVQSCLDCFLGNIQAFRRFGCVQSFDIPHHQDAPVEFRQIFHCCFEQIPQFAAGAMDKLSQPGNVPVAAVQRRDFHAYRRNNRNGGWAGNLDPLDKAGKLCRDGMAYLDCLQPCHNGQVFRYSRAGFGDGDCRIHSCA